MSLPASVNIEFVKSRFFRVGEIDLPRLTAQLCGLERRTARSELAEKVKSDIYRDSQAAVCYFERPAGARPHADSV
jgi:hypothetical protein